MLATALHSADVHSILDNLVSGLVILVLGVMGGAIRRHARALEAKVERAANDVVTINEATRQQVGADLEHTRKVIARLASTVNQIGERTARVEGVLGIIPGHPSRNSKP